MTAIPSESRDLSCAREFVERPLDQTTPAWSALVPGTEKGFYDTQSWHLANADLTGAESSVLVHRDSRLPDRIPHAVIPVYRYPGAPANPALDPARLFAAGGLDPAAWGPITLLGTTVGYETSPLCRETDQAWWARAAELAAAERSGTVACLYLDERDARRLAAQLPGAVLLLSQARTVLPILGRTVPEHLAALTDKQRRKGRKEPERLKLTGRRASRRPLRPEDVAGYVALQMCTQRKHGAGGTGDWFAATFHRYAESPPLQRSAVIFLIEHDGVPVGYTLAFRHDDALVLRTIGVNYDRATEGEYFSLLVHEPARYCVEHGLSKVGFGLAAYRQKLLRGGRLVPQYSVLHPPPGWTDGHTHRHNTSAAESLLRETEGVLAEPELRVLQRIARTGQAGI